MLSVCINYSWSQWHTLQSQLFRRLRPGNFLAQQLAASLGSLSRHAQKERQQRIMVISLFSDDEKAKEVNPKDAEDSEEVVWTVCLLQWLGSDRTRRNPLFWSFWLETGCLLHCIVSGPCNIHNDHYSVIAVQKHALIFFNQCNHFHFLASF